MRYNGCEIKEINEIEEGKEYLLWKDSDCCAVVGRVIGKYGNRYITVYNEKTDNEDCKLFDHCGLIPWEVEFPKRCMTPVEILMKFELQGCMVLSNHDVYEHFVLDLNRKDCLYSGIHGKWFTPKEAYDCGYKFLDGKSFYEGV